MSIVILRALGEASVRAPIVALLVAALLAVLRVRASDVRHAAWAMVVCAMLVLPLRSVVPFDATIPLPPALSVLAPSSLSATFAPNVSTASEGRAAPVEAAVPSAIVPPVGSSSSAGRPLDASLHTAATSSPTDRRQRLPLSWRDIALVVYLAGLLWTAVRCWLGWRMAIRLAERGRVVTRDALDVIGTCLRERVVVRESAAVATPVTIGVGAPTILLPTAWRTWPQDTTRAVLAHELAHVERRDALWLLVVRVNGCLFWFHPLAAWLRRALAVHAEHACDAAAIDAIGERRRYAAVLVDMARASHDRGGRLSWLAVGIGGPRMLGRRIDRVLARHSDRPSSRHQRYTARLACVFAITIAAACRPESSVRHFTASDAIEQRDGALRRMLWSLQAHEYRDFTRADWDMTPQPLPSLEAAVAANPDDLDALKRLLIAYWVAPARDRRRALILRLIDRHPESVLAGSVEARLFPQDIEPDLPGDLLGYDEARRLWLAHVERADAMPEVLGNAAYFFEPTDPQLAESILLRARARDPHGPWPARLGDFYARVLTGIKAPASKTSLRVLRKAEPRTPYGIGVRKKLAESTDTVLLTAAGWMLSYAPSGPFFEYDGDLWAEACFKRVLQLEPEAIVAHTGLLRVRAQRERGRSETLWEAPPALQYQTVAATPEPERFGRLPRLARQSYMEIEGIARWNDPNLRERLDLARQNARQYAEDALALASKYRGHPDYGTAIYTANMTLGALALRDGDTAKAVRFLLKAADAPASEALAYGDDVVSGNRWHLAADLLKRGERDAVIRFLTRMADTNIARRIDLREAIAAIRRGETPPL